MLAAKEAGVEPLDLPDSPEQVGARVLRTRKRTRSETVDEGEGSETAESPKPPAEPAAVFVDLAEASAEEAEEVKGKVRGCYQT